MNKGLPVFSVIWFALSLLPGPARAQITLARQVVSCLGNNGSNGDISISGTAGQSGYTTETSETLIVTQGFQQPRNRVLLVEFELSDPTCDNGLSWVFDIVSLEGCGTGQEFTVLFQGSAVTLPLEGSGNDTLFIGIVAGVNCASWLAIPVTYPEQDCFLVFPDMISPNGDNLNEYWHISGIELPEFSINELKVFNRWGQTIWEGRNYDNQNIVFEGEDNNGAKIPDGTYFYELRAGGNTYDGYIEILR